MSKKYSLTQQQLKGIANLCVQEQGSLKGCQAEASLMCNLFEKQSKYSDLYSYVRNGGWFAYAAKYMDTGSSSSQIVDAVYDVICNGNRTLPNYIDEHDCFSDIKSISTGDNVSDRSAYIKDKTIIKNRYGSTYMFYCFPDTYTDPFGYTQKPMNLDNTSDSNTTTFISSVLSIAKKEIGYLEKATNEQLSEKTTNAGYNNYTKYWYDVEPDLNGEPWCACFVSWCFMKAFGLSVAQQMFNHWPFVYCPTLAAMTTNYEPIVGSVILFYRDGEYVHTGIVSDVTDDTIVTIEGNTSGGSNIIDNGGGVCQKTYKRSNLSSKTKYFMPNYDLANETYDFFNSYITIEYGDVSYDVRQLQEYLNQLGYQLDVDGEFGDITLNAIKDFQTLYNLEVDGIVGYNTRKAIKTALDFGLPKPDVVNHVVIPTIANIPTNKYYTIRAKVPIRAYHSSTSSIIGRTGKKGEQIQITNTIHQTKNKKLWFEVIYGDIKGWIYESNFDIRES